MCDYLTPEGPCGTIFSEAEEGWSTGIITVVKDGIGRNQTADFCPDHTRNPNRPTNYPRFRPNAPALPSGDTSEKED